MLDASTTSIVLRTQHGKAPARQWHHGPNIRCKPLWKTHRKTTRTFTLYSSNLSPNWAESGAFLLRLNKETETAP
jgi:hypothetical protein